MFYAFYVFMFSCSISRPGVWDCHAQGEIKSKRYTENSHAHSEVKSRRHTLLENNRAHSEVKS